MPMPKDENERVELLKSLGQQPGVSAWFSVWQMARIGQPAPEVWGGATRQAAPPALMQLLPAVTLSEEARLALFGKPGTKESKSA